MDEVLTILPVSLLMASPLTDLLAVVVFLSFSIQIPCRSLWGSEGPLFICVPQELGGQREGERLRSFLQNLLEVPVVFASWLNSYRAVLNREVTEFNFTPIVGGCVISQGSTGTAETCSPWWRCSASGVSCETRLQRTCGLVLP